MYLQNDMDTILQVLSTITEQMLSVIRTAGRDAGVGQEFTFIRPVCDRGNEQVLNGLADHHSE